MPVWSCYVNILLLLHKNNPKKKAIFAYIVLNGKWIIWIFFHLGKRIRLYCIATKLIESFMYRDADRIKWEGSIQRIVFLFILWVCLFFICKSNSLLGCRPLTHPIRQLSCSTKKKKKERTNRNHTKSYRCWSLCVCVSRNMNKYSQLTTFFYIPKADCSAFSFCFFLSEENISPSKILFHFQSWS